MIDFARPLPIGEPFPNATAAYRWAKSSPDNWLTFQRPDGSFTLALMEPRTLKHLRLCQREGVRFYKTSQVDRCGNASRT